MDLINLLGVPKKDGRTSNSITAWQQDVRSIMADVPRDRTNNTNVVKFGDRIEHTS